MANVAASSENSAKSAPVDMESYRFNSDVTQLMSLIINTFYSNKDIFLRELLSNASDALDKIRQQSLTNPKVLESEKDLKIEIIPDKESNTLTIRDTGVGMTKEELINNLGTIARSGTKAFMEATDAGADITMIGQFGVGFYSAFLVADKVVVRSKSNDDELYVWESSADKSFSVCCETDEEKKSNLKRGTEIVLFMKEDQLDYLEERTIKNLVKKHSEYILYAINLWTSKEVEKEVTDDEESEKEDEGDESKIKEMKDDGEEEETKEGEEVKKKTKKVKELKEEWELLNTTKPIWLRKGEEVEEKEYNDFYKNLTNDYEDPLISKRFEVEGSIKLQGILFCPKRAPFDMFEKKPKQNNLSLFVRSIFVTDDCTDLCPEFFRFIRGAVNSQDLPLNISRESLQQSKLLKIIRKQVVKKIIEMIDELAEDKEKFKTFYSEFSKYTKLGVHEDSTNRNKLVSYLRFHTSDSQDEEISLDEYIDKMKEGQNSIYYIIGENLNSVKTSPFLEALKKKKYEVVFMTDAIDEYCVQQVKEYNGKKLVCITKENLDLNLSEEEKKELEKEKKDFENLCQTVKNILGKEVEKVVISDRMVNSPCSIVTGEYGWTANMEQIMKRQPLSGSGQMGMYMSSKKTMEINPKNKIIVELKDKLSEDPKDATMKDLVWLLYKTALLSSGFSLDDPASFASQVHNFVKLGLSIVDDEKEEDVPPLEEVGGADEDVSLEQVD